MKRALTILTVFLLLINTGVLFVSASETSGTWGQLSWTLKDGILTISGEGEMQNEIDYPDPDHELGWQSYADIIERVVIENGVTTIGELVFWNHTNLVSVTLPQGLTTIHRCAFSNCTSLTDINIPDTVTYLGGSCFSGCIRLKDIILPDSVTTIDAGAFSGTAIKELTIPKSVSKIYTAQSLVAGCHELESITVDKENLVYYSEGNCIIERETKALIMGCKNSVIPEGVRKISMGAFDGVSELYEVIIPDGVTLLYWCFSGCKDLYRVVISSDVKEITGKAFNSCDNLKNIYFTGTEEEWNNIIMSESGAWTKDYNIIYNYTPPTNRYGDINGNGSVNSLDSALLLQYDAGLRELDDNAIAAADFNADGKVTSLDAALMLRFDADLPIYEKKGTCGDLTWHLDQNGTLRISGTGEMQKRIDFSGSDSSLIRKIKKIIVEDGVTSICHDAFSDYYDLVSVTLPNGLTRIPYNAFRNCYSLTEINIPSSVLYLDSDCFRDCKTLKTIVGLDGVTDIADCVFYGCEALTKIDIPKSTVNISYYVFSGCKSLETITVNTDNPVYYSEGNCIIERETKTLIAGCKNSVIPDGVIRIGKRAFANCLGLTKVVIPDSITNIDAYAFYSCNDLEEIVVLGDNTSINASAFHGCISLENAPLP
ncbi:MAG: leucine-rich repeat protein [Clostridia bacterium]|nr:leucine-rich repeat protein [Clostridia bacterium]